MLNRFQKTLLFAVGLVAIVAVLDFMIYPAAFYGYSFTLGFIASVLYYIFSKDLSEAVAVFATYIILLMGGLWDFIYYIFDSLFCIINCGFQSSMPHLYDNIPIGLTAKLLGYSTVTPFTLTISSILSGIVAYQVIKYLKKQPW